MPLWFIRDCISSLEYPPLRSCLSLAMILFSSFRFRLIGSTCRNRYIRLWLYVSFRVLLWYFCTMDGSFKKWYASRCFTLARLLIARVHYADNPKSIRHYAVFTPCERIPLSIIYPTSLRGVDYVVLFVCLLLFRRLTNNGPIAVIGDTVLQTWYSSPLTTCTTAQFSKLVPSETAMGYNAGSIRPFARMSRSTKDQVAITHDADIIANVEIVPWSWGKWSSGMGWGCLSVVQKISTPRESRHSSTAPMRLIRAIMGFLALCGSVDDRL